MKKIVYVTESMGGGVLTYLQELSNALCNKAKIYILYGVRKQTPNNLNKLFNNKVTLIKINNFQRSLNIIKDFKAYLEVEHWIKKINPNIIHLNSSKAGALGRLMVHHRGQKWFYTPHGYAFLMKNDSRIKRLFYYLVELMLAKLGTTTIACGKGECKIARKLSQNSTYVNNGVNTSKLNKYWSNKSNTENVFFTIGRINFQKNPKLFNRIATRFPHNKFVWCGNGPLKNELTSNNIIVTGWLPKCKLFKLIQPYKYFILCSKWEGLPMALLESMYYKKCCFATNVVDLINNKNNGYLFNSDKNFIKIFHNNNINYEKLGNNAYNIVVHNYNLRDMIDNYIKKYNLKK